jgi:tripartite-type tricarboxylate transporter receptor subunit TctC
VAPTSWHDLIGQWLSERLDQQFVVENRPGAGTNIATEAVVNAPPDGYTLLLACLPNASNATLYGKLNFNFIRDIAPIAAIAHDTFVIEVNPSVPVKTVPELIAYAKVNSGKINMASGGIGSGNHIFGELFKMMTGVNLVHVPYRGFKSVQLNPVKSSYVAQPLAAVENPSILVQYRPDGSRPIYRTLPGHYG